MGKGIAIGVVIGALIAVVLFKALEARGTEAGAGGAPAGAGADSGGAAAADPEREALRKELAGLSEEEGRLQAELKALDAKLAAAKGAGGAKGGTRASRNPWAAIGAKMYKLRDKLGSEQDQEDEEIQQLWVELLDIARQVMTDRGIAMDEFQISPFGVPMILLAILEASDMPPDAAQAKLFDGLVDKVEADWKAMEARRAEMSSLERMRAMMGMTGGALDDIKGALTPVQTEMMEGINTFNRDAVHYNKHSMSGSRDSVRDSIVADLRRTIGLDESADTPLRPVVDEYLRAWDDLQAQFAREEAAGKPRSDTAQAQAELDLMISLQKRVGDSVRLDDAQKKALAEFDHGYNVDIEGAGGADK